MYEYRTTFNMDFAIAEQFGGFEAVKDTAKRAFDEWKNDIEYLTELVMVINHRCWNHYHNGDNTLSNLYSDMYYEYYDKAIDYLVKNSNKDQLNYFIRTLD